METATPAAPALAGPAALQRAHALFLQRRDAEALPHARAAADALPQRADAWTLLGILQQRLGHPCEAEAAYREATRVKPDYADAWTNLGNLLRDLGDLRGTLRAFQQAMRCAPTSAEPPYNLGVALEQFGLWDGALAAFQAAVECDPCHVDAHWNLALALLRAGSFEQGFRAYEWRFQRGEPGPRACAQPVWDANPLAGRTILVWAEQGFGDTLQFLRFVPELARRGGRVVLEVMDGLQGLASRLPGVAAVVVRGTTPPPFDTHVALMSLPHMLALAHPHDHPHPHAPYLRACEALARRWRERITASADGAGRELAVGLVWAGNPALRNSSERSPGLKALEALLRVRGARFHSLQIGPACDELAGLVRPSKLIDFEGEIASFDDTAAIVANLDVVVSCDTAVAHLAGALGKPVFAMLPHSRDWRYGLDAHASPWYPTMRLFRQHTRGDWTDVVARVTHALEQAVASLSSQALASAHS